MEPLKFAQGLKIARDALRDAILEALALRDTPKFKIDGGLAELSDVFTDETPTRFQFCCRWQSDKPTPVDFIALPMFANNANFVPVASTQFPAGQASIAALHSTRCGLFRIRCGVGPDARVVFSDLVGGRFSLGPQTCVEVFATVWGTAGLAPLGSPIVVRSAVAPSDGSGDYLPYTMEVVLAAAASAGPFLPPAGARFFDIGVRGATIGVDDFKVRTSFQLPVEREYLTRVFTPGLATPTPVGLGAFFFENYGALALTSTFPGFIKFWVQL